MTVLRMPKAIAIEVSGDTRIELDEETLEVECEVEMFKHKAETMSHVTLSALYSL
jgi:hypothetical protein